MSTVAHEAPEFTRKWVNLADARRGAMALRASDEFFAAKERMLQPEPAVFIPGKYDDHGKWMDGWETRRKRIEGNDWCVVRLAWPGMIKGVDIDTSHFTGNFPPAASIEACASAAEPDERAAWTPLLPATSLRGDSHHYIAVDDPRVWTHLRLTIYPDGGIARLRVFGQVVPTLERGAGAGLIDLAALEHGGRAVACNNEHFGSMWNLIAPGRGINMGDGWETRRRREPGNDWVILALGVPGSVLRVEVDTAHFKGNYPDRCSLQAAHVAAATDQSLVVQSMFWRTLLPEQKLEMDRQHSFEQEVVDLGPITHVRLNIIPDGGVSRLRLFGTPS
ncbi:MAG TPA: allantoicase [Burkholderiales bacterium]|nr:allantoicase [Burkholderiales bacterium]